MDPGAVPGASTTRGRHRLDTRGKGPPFARHDTAVIGSNHRCQRQRGPEGRRLKNGPSRFGGAPGNRSPPTSTSSCRVPGPNTRPKWARVNRPRPHRRWRNEVASRAPLVPPPPSPPWSDPVGVIRRRPRRPAAASIVAVPSCGIAASPIAPAAGWWVRGFVGRRRGCPRRPTEPRPDATIVLARVRRRPEERCRRGRGAGGVSDARRVARSRRASRRTRARAATSPPPRCFARATRRRPRGFASVLTRPRPPPP